MQTRVRNRMIGAGCGLMAFSLLLMPLTHVASWGIALGIATIGVAMVAPHPQDREEVPPDAGV